MNRHARYLFLAGTALGAGLLGACGKHDNTPAATTPAAASTAATPMPAHSAPAPMPARAASTPAPAATAPASAGSSAAAPAVDNTFKVADVQLGDTVTAAYKIAKPTTSFAPTQKTIYASVATTGSTSGATLSAHFSYLEGKGQPVSTISQTIATDGPATTTFKLHNPHDWPAGKYKVEISLDGKPVSSQTFEVKAA